MRGTGCYSLATQWGESDRRFSLVWKVPARPSESLLVLLIAHLGGLSPMSPCSLLMKPGRWRQSVELGTLLLLMLYESVRTDAADSAPESVEEVRLYGRTGSSVLFPGVTTELIGQGVLEWWFLQRGGLQAQWILSYFYGTNEAEIDQKYNMRVQQSFKNASLQLWNLTKLDTGEYDLQLKFRHTKRICLEVLDPILELVVVPIRSASICRTWLRCEASGDVWNMTWKEDGTEVFHNITQREDNISELVIAPDSTSVYTCEASNPDMKLEKSYQPAQESFDGLFVFSFHLAGLIFSVPMLILWINDYMCRKARCRLNVNTVAALACWSLFLICALCAASIVHASSTVYGNPVLNILCLVAVSILLTTEVMWFMCNNREMFPEHRNLCSGVCPCIETAERKKGEIILLFLRLVVFGLFSFTVGNYFQEYFSVCHLPPAFEWGILIAVLVPVGSIALIFWRFHRCSNGADKQPRDGGNPQERVELNELQADSNDHVKVENGETFNGP